MKNMFFVFAAYTSKYGRILYVVKVSGPVESFVVDADNVYIQTMYYKGSDTIKAGEFVELQFLKGENGLLYCFK